MSWTRRALLPGGARTQQISVVPARAPAVNGIRPDDFPPGTLAPTALLGEVLLVLRPLGGVKAGVFFLYYTIYKYYE